MVFHEGAVSWQATIKPERNAAEAAIREGAVSWRTTIKSALIKRGAWHCGVIASLLRIIGNKNRETCLNRQNLRLIMSALQQTFFNAQKFGKKQGLRVPKSIAADIYKIDANPVE